MLCRAIRAWRIFLRSKNEYKLILTPLLVFSIASLNVSMACAAGTHVVINEVLYQAEGNNDTGKEWIELFNPTKNPITLTGYELYTGAGGYFVFPEFSLKPKSFVVVHLRREGGNSSDDLYQGMNEKSNMGNTAGSIALFSGHTHSENTMVDFIEYGKIGQTWEGAAIKRKLWNQGEFIAKAVTEGDSIALVTDGEDTESSKDWIESCGKNGTPGKNNNTPCHVEEKIQEPEIYSKNIIINELFPNPFKSAYEEYIELYNGGETDVNLYGWTLHDSSKTGEYTFPENTIIKAGKYFAVFKGAFEFALNNLGHESVTLFDPNGEKVSFVGYDGTKQDASYDFNGSEWHWTKFLTPGEENEFEDTPNGKLEIEKDIYRDMYADFAVLGLAKNAKVIWDFGDGHKSYLQKTRHKYVQAGAYAANVKFSEGSEDVLKNFSVEVKKFPHPDVHIISLNANPQGSDSKNESFTIKNNSKKKLNLKNWSIATGWKKLANHPITKDLIIKGKKTKKITRKYSKFTLNNKQGKIELRYPDGETAYKVKYKKEEGSIAENEVYQKVEGGWGWKQDVSSILYKVSSINAENPEDSPKVQEQNVDENTEEIPSEEVLGIEKKKELPQWLKENDSEIAMLKETTEKLNLKEIDGAYFFARQGKENEHYAIVFLKSVSFNTNTRLNMLLNYFFN
ncbi:MAG TPA: lamin tail domain-containing protein [Patescibacteria group bacterium]